MGSLNDDDDNEMEYGSNESSSEEEAELVRKITRNIKEGRDHLLEWREEARSCYDYFAGAQWDEADVQKLNEENRPAIVFNRVFRTLNGVTGLETQNRQDIKFDPMEEDDGGKTDIWNAAIKWVRSNSDAEDEESEMFQDTAICGMGWTETRVDYDDNLNGDIIGDRIDPLDMLYDPNARKRNLSDTRWRARHKEFKKDEFKELWPEKTPQYGNFWPQEGGDLHDATEAWKYENDQSDPLKKNRGIPVIQYQWWERETIYRVVDHQGNIQGFKDHKFEKIKDFVESEGLKHIKQQRKVFRQAFVNGTQILEMGEAPINRFSFNCMTGFRNRNKNTWFGIVSPMKDPQMWANKWLSQILHIVNSNAKGGALAEEGAFKNLNDAKENWAKPNSIIMLNPGALAGGKIQQREPARYPEGVANLLQLAMQNISDIPGVNLEMLGVANRDQPAALELSRKEAGITILAPLFDGLRRYRKTQGRILAEFIEKYITDGRLIRIVGDRKKQYIPLLKDKLSLKYDVVIDESPSSPNMQERVFAIISSLLPTLLQAGIPIPPEILDYAPIPETLKSKWKEMLNNPEKQQKDQQMQQMSMMMAQLEAAKKEKEVAETESKTVLNMAKAQQAAATGQDEAAQAANKMGLAHAEQANKNEQSSWDVERKNNEMIINQRRKELEFNLQQLRKDQEHEAKLKYAEQMHAAKMSQNQNKGE
jgi:hypothetical protein